MAPPDQRRELGFVVTHTIIVKDIRRSAAFYRDVLGGTVLREGAPTMLRLGNIWVIINGGAVRLTTSQRSLPPHRGISISSAAFSTSG